MRIIGGEARGRVVRLPGGSRIRPTADRVKESLFNILHIADGTSFLDLFAGSGNVGLEALSRGARFAAFVEKEMPLARALEDRLVQFGFAARAEVIAADAQRGLGRLVRQGKRFDVIFSDPPYNQGLTGEALAWPDMREALAENGILVLQHSTREKPEELRDRPWMVADQRRYGDTVLSFLKGRDLESVPKTRE